MDAVGDSAPLEAAADASPVVREAMERFRRCSEWEANWRERFIDDVKFAEGDSDNGYQWPFAVKRNRDVDKRPCLTFNIVRQHNLQITNEAKQNRSAIKIRAVGGGATKDSADLLGALIRQIEYRSRANEAQGAYEWARKYQVQGGIGWWRLATQYVTEDSFDQEIRIARVIDPLSVYIDTDAKEGDYSDANYALVFDLIPKKDFYDAYPEYAGPDLQPLGVGTGDSDFVTKESVRVVEYFRRVTKRDKVVSFIDPSSGRRKTVRKSLLPKQVWDGVKDLPLTKTRDTKTSQIEWYLIAGEMVIDQTDWPGKYIPLIPVIGEEAIVEGLLDRKGHTRAMKDGQRMFNYNAALATDTKIPTPFGWTTMGLLRAGDWVFGQNGLPVQVKTVLPIRTSEPCYKVTFDTGYSVVTDEGHIWKVEERGKRRAEGYDWHTKTVATNELTSGKHFIRVTEPLDLGDKELPIDPYLLGMWLGDGCTASTSISCHVDDLEEEQELLSRLGYTVGRAAKTTCNGTSFYVHGVRHKFVELGLLGDKHVPAVYMRASAQQRLALLQGLMDTDGHFAEKVNQCVFINTDPVIVRALLELCASLGIKTTVDKGQQTVRMFPDKQLRVCKAAYRVQFTTTPGMSVFRLERKAKLQTQARNTHWRRTKRVGIESVERVESTPVRCITLDSADHLFLCSEGMIPTHNSAQVEFVALQSKTPYLVAAKAIEEYESMWNTANQVNHSVLVFNAFDPDYPDKPLPPPIRQQPPASAPGFQEGMQTAFNQMMMASGQWQNQMGMQGNERTGAAINARLKQGDTSTFHFQDNYAGALKNTARQLLDLIPRVYDTKRLMKLRAEDGEEMDVEFNPAAPQVLMQQMAADGQVVNRVLNPALGEYDVEADVGPAYGTRRQETQEAMTLILTQAPALTGLIGDLLLRAFDFREAQEAADRLRRMVPPQAMGKGPSPQELQLQQQLAASQRALAEALQKLGQQEVKLLGKAEMRDIDVYKAETDRVKALAALLPSEPGVLQGLIDQLGDDALSTNLRRVLEANKQQLAAEATEVEPTAQLQQPPTTPAMAGGEQPPHPGAMKAQDGNWYLTDPTRRGRYLRIMPLATERAIPKTEIGP